MSCIDENVAVCFLAGELTEQAAAEVDRHMDECPDCLRRLATFARTQAASMTEELAGDSGSSRTTRGISATRAAATAVLRRGTVVGRYAVLDLVGAGAMGSVYSAADPLLRRTVALKLVRAVVGVDLTKSTDRLVDEARMLAQVVHPNVVAVHDVGTFDGQVFLAMDFVEGQTLRDWLAAPRSAADVLRAFVEAGRGLVAAHAAGVVHRDFKPDNVLVGNDGRVVVTDFGLARQEMSADEAAPAVVGTPAYMAPEQRRGVPADHRADQFSFCVALYEALFGERPFTPATATTAGPLDRLVPPRPRVAVRRRVRRALARGLAELPERRHPSMTELLRALTDDPWRGRRYGLVAIAAALLVAFVLVRRERQGAREIASCHIGPERLSGVWDGARKQAMHAAFRATGKPYAEDAWRNVETAVDTYSRDWDAASAGSCEATHVRHDQSPALFALRATCYRERFEELRAVVDVIASADQDIVKNASSLVRELGPLAPCSDERSLHAMAPPEPAIAPEVARLRGALARARALRNAGRMKEGLAAVTRASDESVALGYLPLEAFALLELGLVQSRMGDKVTADATLARAARIADSARDDASRVRAVSHRLFIHGNVWKRAGDIADLDAEASSALARIGGADPRVEEAYRYNIGMAFFGLRDFDRAFASLERAAALSEKVYGPKSDDAARGQSGLCVVLGTRGDLERAIPYCERTAAMFREALGPLHPDYALAAQNLGSMLLSLDRTDDACARIEEGYRIGEAALGPEHLQVIAAESNLGECMNRRGEYARAIELLEHALALRERIPSTSPVDLAHTQTKLARALVGANLPERALPIAEVALRSRDAAGVGPEDRAATRFVLARALWDSGRDRPRAKSLARQALQLWDEGTAARDGKPARERSDVEVWLGQHPS